MPAFNYFQPTSIHFGSGRLSEIGQLVANCGTRCLLVTMPPEPFSRPVYARIKRLLKKAGVEVAHFSGVVVNPTTDSITAGAKAARAHKANVVLGLGGGSAMDSAKAIAVECTHKGTAWDYRWCCETQPGPKTLPVIAVTTTSGTGSQVTQVAVMTNPATRDKSAIYNSIVYPHAAVVDPELMLTVPPRVTAATGFDVFCHAFETYLHPGASPYTDLLALEAIRLVARQLPRAVKAGGDLKAREALAWADTLAGLCIASAGVTLPHGIGMAIGGMYPHVAHGEALALNYPAFTRFTWKSAIPRFATVGRILNPRLAQGSSRAAAERCCAAIDGLLRKIGLWQGLSDYNVPEAELPALARQCLVLPDYQNNPRVIEPAEMLDMLNACYRR